MSNKDVGFIGLGVMGSHMAQNLVNAGHNVIAYDIVKENLDKAVSGGRFSTATTINVRLESGRPWLCPTFGQP